MAGRRALAYRGNYTVNRNTLTLSSTLDGTTTFAIEEGKDGTVLRSSSYVYYDSEEAALAGIKAKEEKEEQDAGESLAQIQETLIGEWVSLDGMVISTYTDSTITVHFLGDSMGSPEAFVYYDYKLISDKEMSFTGADGIEQTFSYLLYEEDGKWNLISVVKDYAANYVKRDDGESSNSLQSQYDAELTELVNANIVGTWLGQELTWQNEEEKYQRYTFNEDGTYTFYQGNTPDGEATESGTYTIVCDADNMEYFAVITLVHDGGTREFPMNLYDKTPMEMKGEMDFYFVKQ